MEEETKITDAEFTEAPAQPVAENPGEEGVVENAPTPEVPAEEPAPEPLSVHVGETVQTEDKFGQPAPEPEVNPGS